jgi:hypothetical protein
MTKKQQEAAQRQMDQMIAMRNNASNAALSAAELEHKRQQMEKYRADLDTLVQAKTAAKAYGNMTNIEKQLNRDDLTAYKNYDPNVYALIPGIAHQKASKNNGSQSPGPQTSMDNMNTMSAKKKPALNETIAKNEQRMAKYGLQNMAGVPS